MKEIAITTKFEMPNVAVIVMPNYVHKQVKPAFGPSGPSGRRLSRVLWHEATRCISTLPRWESIAGLPPQLGGESTVGVIVPISSKFMFSSDPTFHAMNLGEKNFRFG